MGVRVEGNTDAYEETTLPITVQTQAAVSANTGRPPEAEAPATSGMYHILNVQHEQFHSGIRG